MNAMPDMEMFIASQMNEVIPFMHVTDICSLLSEIKSGYKTYDTIVNIVNHTCLNSVNSRYTFYGHIDHEWILNS